MIKNLRDLQRLQERELKELESLSVPTESQASDRELLKQRRATVEITSGTADATAEATKSAKGTDKAGMQSALEAFEAEQEANIRRYGRIGRAEKEGSDFPPELAFGSCGS